MPTSIVMLIYEIVDYNMSKDSIPYVVDTIVYSIANE